MERGTISQKRSPDRFQTITNRTVLEDNHRQPLGGWLPSSLTPIEIASPTDLELTTDQLRIFDRSMFALVGTELKAATIIHGLSTTPRTVAEVIRCMKNALPPKTPLPQHAMVSDKYFDEWFSPAGIIDERRINGHSYYSLTEDASRYALPIAACLLDYTAESGLPMSTIMSTPRRELSEDGSRAYINRTALLLYLHSHSTHKSDLLRVFQFDPNRMKEYLHEFRDIGFIDYEYADTEVPGWGIYERVGEPEIVKHDRVNNRLRRNVVEYFRANSVGNSQTIAEALGRNDKLDVHKILSQLVDDGFLKREKWHGGVVQSSAKMRGEGKEFVETRLLPILRFCGDDQQSASQLQQTLRQVESDPSISAKAIQSYKEARMKVPRAETERLVLDLIRDNGPQRPRQIAAVFGGKVDPIITGLLKDGKLAKKKEGHAAYYFLPIMEEPMPEKLDPILAYRQPENLLPPTCRPRQEYLAEVEKEAFWQELLEDLSHITPNQVTEREFYWFYSPTNPDWKKKNNYK